MATTDDRMLKYLEQIANQNKEKGPSLGLGSGPEDFKKALTVSKDAFNKLTDEAKNSLSTWRDLSKAGAGFSNDVIGMSTAAAQSRMSLEEFSQVIKENGKYMTGLGGSVGRGAEVFSKLSKSFFDSNMDRGLRELGYTSKELNDVLALTAGAQKSAFSDTEAGQKRTNQAAAAMAKEMDLIAKLTGKSRAEQMEEMTKRKVDGQTEAKLRLLTANKTEEEAAAIRLEYQKGLLEAQKQGTEQSYKEFFATGTYLSEEAATQAALLGKQARAQEESIKAMQGGDFAKSAEARERSAAESLKNQSDTTLLTVATLGSAAGTAGEAMVKQVEVNDALFHSVSKVKAEYEAQTGTMISYSEALKIAKERIEQEQAGRDKNGKAVSGATDGLIAVEKAQQDFKAGLAAAAEAVDKDGKGLANSLRDLGTVVSNTVKNIAGETQGGNIGKNIGERAQAGLRGEAAAVDPTQGKLKAEEAKRQAGGGVVGEAVRGATAGADLLVQGAAKTAGALTGPNNPIGPMGGAPIQKREIGGPVDAGTPYLVGEGGKAEIFVPKAAGDIVPMDKVGSTLPPPPPPEEQKSFAESMAASVRKGMQTVGVDPNMRGNPTGGMDGFDLSSISKDISTTISSVAGGGSSTTRSVQNEDSLDASKELKSVKEQMAAEKAALAAKFKEQMPEAGSRQLRNAINNSDESKQISAKYDALIGPLEKRIEEGIKWEVETKQAGVEETKKTIEAELIAKEQFSDKVITNEEEQNKKLVELQSTYGDQTAEEYAKERELQQAALKSAEEQGPEKISKATPAEVKNPLLNDKGKVSLNKLNLPGMPSFGKSLAPNDPKPADPKGAAASISEEAKRADAKKAEEKKKAEDAKKAEAAKGTPAAKPTGSVQQTASLNDVVKSLDQLNMQMGQLISQQSDLIRKQTSSMLAAGSNNVYDKTR
jgi:hypothetical protein